MGILNYFRWGYRGDATSSVVTTSNNSTLDQQMYTPLTYVDCQNLYSYIPLAKRIINLPVKIAMNKMNITFGDKKLEEIEELRNIDIDNIKAIALDYIIKVRLYGYSILMPLIENDDVSKSLLKSNLYNKDIRYNILDPLQVMVDIERNPTSYNYKKITNIKCVLGSTSNIYPKRCLALQNNLNNLYLQYNRASFNYIGLSELQVCRPLLNLISSAITSQERQLLFSSTFILEKDESADNINIQALTENANLLSDIKQDSTVILSSGLKLSQFKLDNFDTINSSIDNLQKLIALSSDIPSFIFTDTSIDEAFSNSDNQASIIETYFDNIRINLITPTIKFILAHEIYSKIDNILKVEELISSMSISFNSLFTSQEVLKHAENFSEDVVSEALNVSGEFNDTEVKAEVNDTIDINENRDNTYNNSNKDKNNSNNNSKQS